MEDMDDLEDLEPGPKFARKLRGFVVTPTGGSDRSSHSQSPSNTSGAASHGMSNSPSISRSATPSGSTSVSDGTATHSGRVRKRPRGFSPSPEVETTKRTTNARLSQQPSPLANSPKPSAQTLLDSAGFAIPSAPAVRKSNRKSVPARLSSASVSPDPESPDNRKEKDAGDGVTSEVIRFRDFIGRHKQWPADDFALDETFHLLVPNRVAGRYTAKQYWAEEPLKQSTLAASASKPSSSKSPSVKVVDATLTSFEEESDTDDKTPIVRRSAMGAAPFTTPQEGKAPKSGRKSVGLTSTPTASKKKTGPAGNKGFIKLSTMSRRTLASTSSSPRKQSTKNVTRSGRSSLTPATDEAVDSLDDAMPVLIPFNNDESSASPRTQMQTSMDDRHIITTSSAVYRRRPRGSVVSSASPAPVLSTSSNTPDYSRDFSQEVIKNEVEEDSSEVPITGDREAVKESSTEVQPSVSTSTQKDGEVVQYPEPVHLPVRDLPTSSRSSALSDDNRLMIDDDDGDNSSDVVPTVPTPTVPSSVPDPSSSSTRGRTRGGITKAVASSIQETNTTVDSMDGELGSTGAMDVRRSGRRSVPSAKFKETSTSGTPSTSKTKPIPAADPKSALGIIQRSSRFRRHRSPSPEPPPLPKSRVAKADKSHSSQSSIVPPTLETESSADEQMLSDTVKEEVMSEVGPSFSERGLNTTNEDELEKPNENEVVEENNQEKMNKEEEEKVMTPTPPETEEAGTKSADSLKEDSVEKECEQSVVDEVVVEGVPDKGAPESEANSSYDFVDAATLLGSGASVPLTSMSPIVSDDDSSMGSPTPTKEDQLDTLDKENDHSAQIEEEAPVTHEDDLINPLDLMPKIGNPNVQEAISLGSVEHLIEHKSEVVPLSPPKKVATRRASPPSTASTIQTRRKSARTSIGSTTRKSAGGGVSETADSPSTSKVPPTDNNPPADGSSSTKPGRSLRSGHSPLDRIEPEKPRKTTRMKNHPILTALAVSHPTTEKTSETVDGGVRSRRSTHKPSWMDDFDTTTKHQRAPPKPKEKEGTTTSDDHETTARAKQHSPLEKESNEKAVSPVKKVEELGTVEKSPEKNEAPATPRITLKIKFGKGSMAASSISVEDEATDVVTTDVEGDVVMDNHKEGEEIEKELSLFSSKTCLPGYKPAQKPVLGCVTYSDGSTENIGRTVNMFLDKLMADVCHDGVVRHSSWLLTKEDIRVRQRQRRTEQERRLKEAGRKKTEERAQKSQSKPSTSSSEVSVRRSSVHAPLPLLVPDGSLAQTREKRSVRNKYISDPSDIPDAPPHPHQPHAPRRSKREREIEKGGEGADTTEFPSPPNITNLEVTRRDLQELTRFLTGDESESSSKECSPLSSPSISSRRSRRASTVLLPPPPPPEPIRETTPEPVVIDRTKIETTYDEFLRDCGWSKRNPLSYGIFNRNKNDPIEHDLFYREMLMKSPDIDIMEDEIVDVDGLDVEGPDPVDPPPDKPMDGETSAEFASRICRLLPRPLFPISPHGDTYSLEDTMDHIARASWLNIPEDMDLADDESELPRVRLSDRQLCRQIIRLVTSQYVADCAARGVEGGHSIHYVTAQQNAQRFRDTMLVFNKIREMQSYRVHSLMISLLPEHLLAVYITLLRHGKKLRNRSLLVLNRSLRRYLQCERGIAKQVVKILDDSLAKTRLADPNSEEIGRTMLNRTLADVVAICVLPNIYSEDFYDQKPKYHEYVYKMLSAVCNKSSVSLQIVIPDDCDEKMAIPEAVDYAVNIVAKKVRRTVQEYRAKRIVLVGWGTSTYINHRVIQFVPGVSAMIDFAFPTVTSFGPRGSADDDITLTYCPTLFVVGEEAVDFDPRVMANLRSVMMQQTGLVVVGGANENLCVSTKRLTLEKTTQKVVTRGIVEMVIDFLRLDQTFVSKNELIPVELQPTFTVDPAIFKAMSLVRPNGSKSRDDDVTSSPLSPLPIHSHPPSPAGKISRDQSGSRDSREQGNNYMGGLTQSVNSSHAPMITVKSRKRKGDPFNYHPPPSSNSSTNELIPLGHSSSLSAKELARQRFSSVLSTKAVFRQKPSPIPSHPPLPKKRATTPSVGPSTSHAPPPTQSSQQRKSNEGPVDPASISLG